MRRASITIPDRLESALENYRRDLEVPPSLASAVQTALERYLEERGYSVGAGEMFEDVEEIIPAEGPKPRGRRFGAPKLRDGAGLRHCNRSSQVVSTESVTTLNIDTSALVKLYVEEERHEAVFEAVEGVERLATSTVAYAEARAVFARKVRIGDLNDEGHWQAVSDLDGEWRRVRSDLCL